MSHTDMMWRRVVVWSAAAVILAGAAAVLALSIASRIVSEAQTSVESVMYENRLLHDRMALFDRQTRCRVRIADAAEAARVDRDSLGWQALVDRFVAGSSVGLEDRAEEIERLNMRLQEATDRRLRAAEICAENPDFIPPP